MSDITLINDSEQSQLVTNGLAVNGELYLKKEGSTDAGSIVVYDSGVWRTFANEGTSFNNTYSTYFDGTNDSVSTTLTSSLFSSDFTISAWVNPSALNNNFNTLFQLSQGAGYTQGFRIYARSNGTITGYSGANSYAINFHGNFGLSVGSWTHVCLVRSSGSIDGYANGNTTSIATYTDNYNYTDTSFSVNSMPGTGTHFNGYIDECAVWDRALSTSEIASLVSNSLPADIGNLYPDLWWRMGDDDSGTGTTITDQGSGGSNGTLTNGPTFSTSVPS